MMENGYSMDYGDAYMEQEEEWEREGLLDPAWEKQQKKVSLTIIVYILLLLFFSIFSNILLVLLDFFFTSINCLQNKVIKIFFYFAWCVMIINFPPVYF